MSDPTEEPKLFLAHTKVLVVDDTLVNRMILQKYLSQNGADVVLAEDGQKAVEQYTATKPDIILMDVMMPVMDGYEATRHIKKLAGDYWVPVVFLSALDQESNLVEGLAAGGDDFLHKPVNFTVFEAKLRSILRTLKTLQSLTETRARAQAISENIIDGLIIIDERGTIETCNSMSSEIFGYSSAEMIGQNVKILMPDPYHTEHDGYLASYVGGNKPKIIGVGQRLVQGKRKNGEIFELELGVTVITINGERRFMGVVRDVSERVQAQQKLKDNAERLQLIHDTQAEENNLARDIMVRQMRLGRLDDRHIHHWLQPAEQFSGDIVTASRTANGKVYALLADATGHGLSAALTAQPLLALFHNLVEHDTPLEEIVAQANRELRNTLPGGRFVAASFLCLDPHQRKAELWMGGMPEALLLGYDGKPLQRLSSKHLPLGVVSFEADECKPEVINLSMGNQFVLYSDGVTEATDANMEAFGSERLEAALASAQPAKRISAVKLALTSFIGRHAGQDDISILLIDGAAPANNKHSDA